MPGKDFMALPVRLAGKAPPGTYRRGRRRAGCWASTARRQRCSRAGWSRGCTEGSGNGPAASEWGGTSLAAAPAQAGPQAVHNASGRHAVRSGKRSWWRNPAPMTSRNWR